MNTRYQKTRYLTSAPNVKTAPPDEGFEVAFAGRSNAGKSSAINAITQQKSLARVSKTPGRTRMLNFFRVDEQRRLVDLPGYGYAQVPEAILKNWRWALESYFSERRSLRGVFLVMDIRHPLTPFDRRLIEWCQHWEFPLHIALTKADKLGRGAALQILRTVEAELKAIEGLKISLQLFSALKRTGLEEAWAVLDRWLEMPRSNGAE